MEQNEAKKLLLDALRATVLSHTEGYEATFGARHTVVVSRHGHWRGMWQFVNGKYGWVSAGNRQPEFQTENIDEAVTYSRDHIFTE